MSDRDTNAAGGRPPAASSSAMPPGGGLREGAADWTERADEPVYSAILWPNRSLKPEHKRLVMGLLAVGLAIPMIPAFGTPAFWGLLPFEAAAWGALWFSFRRNDADGRLSEALALWPDEIRVERAEPSGRVLRWRADPYWVRITVHENARPEKYLTLKGGGREIELGAFLSPEERVALAEELEGAIRRALRGGAPDMSPG